MCVTRKYATKIQKLKVAQKQLYLVNLACVQTKYYTVIYLYIYSSARRLGKFGLIKQSGRLPTRVKTLMVELASLISIDIILDRG